MIVGRGERPQWLDFAQRAQSPPLGEFKVGSRETVDRGYPVGRQSESSLGVVVAPEARFGELRDKSTGLSEHLPEWQN